MPISLYKTEEQITRRLAIRTVQEDIDCFLLDCMEYLEKRAFLRDILADVTHSADLEQFERTSELQSLASGIALTIKGMRDIARERDNHIVSAIHTLTLDEFMRLAGAMDSCP